jgi:hypothetical protein
MAWFQGSTAETVSDALAANGARHSIGEHVLTAAPPAAAWAGFPADDPNAESRDRATFQLSARCLDATAGLTKWGQITLLGADREVIGEFRAGDSGLLTDTLHSRPDAQAWVRCAPSTVLGAALLDWSALLEAATVPAGPHPSDEPPQAPYVRPVNEARASGVERLPAPPRVRARLIAPGADSRSLAEVGREFLEPKSRRSVVWLGWLWPEGSTLKPHAVGPGVQLVDYLPVEGTQFVRDGIEYRTSWSFTALGHELLDCPGWLLEGFGRARRRSGDPVVDTGVSADLPSPEAEVW